MRPLLLVLLLAAPATAGSVPIARLSASVEVTGTVFRLGDVARIETDDPVVAARLRTFVLGRTPAPNRVIRITQAGLRDILEARRMGRVRIEGARSVSIKARLASFDPDSIRAAARTFLESRIGDLPGRELSFVATTPPVRTMSVPAGSDDTFLDAAYTDVPRTRGEVRITVRAVVDGVPHDARVVRFIVHAREEALVLTRDLRPGEPVDDSCVECRVVDVTDLSDDVLRSMSELRRSVSRRALAAGTPLREQDLRRLPDVRRGDPVEIVYRRASLEVRTQGIALADGRKGAVVRVVNSASGRTVAGRVSGPGVIEVAPGSNGGGR